MGADQNDQQLRLLVAERLRAAIDRLGLEYTAAADQAGIPYRTLQNYIAGIREPKAGALSKICARLGVSPIWVLFGDGDMWELSRPAGTVTESPREEAMLTLFRDLSEDEQREIHAAAEEKKRLRALEQRMEEVAATVAGKRSA